MPATQAAPIFHSTKNARARGCGANANPWRSREELRVLFKIKADRPAGRPVGQSDANRSVNLKWATSGGERERSSGTESDATQKRARQRATKVSANSPQTRSNGCQAARVQEAESDQRTGAKRARNRGGRGPERHRSACRGRLASDDKRRRVGGRRMALSEQRQADATGSCPLIRSERSCAS